MAATMSTIGAALAAVPLAMLANREGRAPALATGALLAASGAALGIVAAVLALRAAPVPRDRHWSASERR